jgi:hypothetical protein
MVLKNNFGFSKIFKKKKINIIEIFFLYKKKQEQKTNKQTSKKQKLNKQKLQITIKLITSLTLQAVHYYHWVETSAGGLLVPEGIIRPVVIDSALTWFSRYIYYRKSCSYF